MTETEQTVEKADQAEKTSKSCIELIEDLGGRLDRLEVKIDSIMTYLEKAIEPHHE